MFLLSFYRVLKFSIQDIKRNFWLSLVTITILVLALFSVNMLLAVNIIGNAAIESVKEKIDVNLYLKNDTAEDKALALKAEISNLSQVREVIYISKVEALDSFREKHKNNPQILEALRELNNNPLAPTLIIQAKDVNQYDALLTELNKVNSEIIESRNFDDHKLMLAKINAISNKINETGILVSSIFVIVTLLVVYNTIRVAIYTHKKEIGIMRLVGASNWFIRSPFLISSLIYALIGTLIIVALIYPFLGVIQPYLDSFFDGYHFNIANYFSDHLVTIFGLEFLGAAIISVLASLMAVGRYSKV